MLHHLSFHRDLNILIHRKSGSTWPPGTPPEQALALAEYLCAKPDGVMLIVLRSLGSPDVLPIVQAELEAFLVPLRERLGPARAYMLVTQMVGFLTLRDMMEPGLQLKDLRPGWFGAS